MSEATLAEEQIEASAETAGKTSVDASVDAGPVCEKCGLATEAAACPKCGWYPSLGIHVDIDQNFEAAMNNLPPAEEADPAAAAARKPSEWQKHLAVWSDLIPLWGWIMIGTTFGAVVAGVACKVISLTSPSLQTVIGVSGLIGGLALALVAHVVAFLICSFDDADFGVADLVIKPGKTWKQIFSELPERVWLANSLNLGVSTALSAALIVGGIPYEKLLDWGFKARAKPNLIAAIAENAPQGEASGSLEDAMGEFTEKAGVENFNPAGSNQAPLPPKPRRRLECLIIGYQTNKAGEITRFLLAADDTGKLKYVGSVRPELDVREQSELLKAFEKRSSTRPFVKTPEVGVWLSPKYMCRVTYTDWERGKRPQDLEWDEMLDELKSLW